MTLVLEFEILKLKISAHLAGAVEYTDCIYAER